MYYYPHKDLEIIPKIINYLEIKGYKNFTFVLTLKEEDFRKVCSSEMENRIINVAPIKSAECPSLYSECDIMFFSTLLECFSASYAEAMIMKKPIITTDMGFAHTGG